ncbi:hypothetical protein VFPFJ_09148 [Purpureocillium lilacinum]|uniref:Uncharacterized protein n=1 Tax=Purpureocillium lilacinum TaxID=33203 RepID=A0A179GZB7_PURLI|nr:hypothetical protein VFPFJ_09148 [Purpureocillium lilacinum]OAQ76189.1 hypothetical protein VFPBJ_08549 [Purpureocillium lilacinum]OAQ83345.1 hypothetical protein VFPFJ_09148 [Purpureocillium lilacinum]
MSALLLRTRATTTIPRWLGGSESSQRAGFCSTNPRCLRRDKSSDFTLQGMTMSIKRRYQYVQ